MPYGDFTLFSPPEGQFQTGQEYKTFTQGQALQKASYLSEMDKYYTGIAEQARQFNLSLGEQKREFNISEGFKREAFYAELELDRAKIDLLREQSGLTKEQFAESIRQYNLQLAERIREFDIQAQLSKRGQDIQVKAIKKQAQLGSTAATQDWWRIGLGVADFGAGLFFDIQEAGALDDLMETIGSIF